jgi:hypothetical protein
MPNPYPYLTCNYNLNAYFNKKADKYADKTTEESWKTGVSAET